ncbi:MAG: VapB-type antitoxin [Candidatus Methanodesulfokora sp.]
MKADDRGRIKLPKGLISPGDRILVLPVGRRIVLIRMPSKPLEESSSWIKTDKDKKELRTLAESRAIEEVEEKLRRRDLAGGD